MLPSNFVVRLGLRGRGSLSLVRCWRVVNCLVAGMIESSIFFSLCSMHASVDQCASFFRGGGGVSGTGTVSRSAKNKRRRPTERDPTAHSACVGYEPYLPSEETEGGRELAHHASQRVRTYVPIARRSRGVRERTRRSLPLAPRDAHPFSRIPRRAHVRAHTQRTR